MDFCTIVREYFYMRVTDMATQWSEAKEENCLKFQDINVHNGFNDSKLATCRSIFENSSPACCGCIRGDCKGEVSNSYSIEWP